MADILPDDLASRTSAELLDACGRLQEAYTAALEREAKERETATIRLRREAEPGRRGFALPGLAFQGCGVGLLEPAARLEEFG